MCTANPASSRGTQRILYCTRKDVLLHQRFQQRLRQHNKCKQTRFSNIKKGSLLQQMQTCWCITGLVLPCIIVNLRPFRPTPGARVQNAPSKHGCLVNSLSPFVSPSLLPSLPPSFPPFLPPSLSLPSFLPPSLVRALSLALCSSFSRSRSLSLSLPLPLPFSISLYLSPSPSPSPSIPHLSVVRRSKHVFKHRIHFRVARQTSLVVCVYSQ